MTRHELEIQHQKALFRIQDQNELIENLGKRLETAQLFATALMIITNTEHAEFTRDELRDIKQNKMIGYSELKDVEGHIVGVQLDLKVEIIKGEVDE